MGNFARDDAPELFSLSRRRILIGGGLLLGALATATGSLSEPITTALANSVDPFMRLSSLLIQHRLNKEVGQRLVVGMSILNPRLPEHTCQLLAIANAQNARCVEDFFPAVPEGPLKATALAIISAWYLGVIVEGPDADVFAYEFALLYQPTADVMTIPSYAKTGPSGWNSESPSLLDMPGF